MRSHEICCNTLFVSEIKNAYRNWSLWKKILNLRIRLSNYVEVYSTFCTITSFTRITVSWENNFTLLGKYNSFTFYYRKSTMVLLVTNYTDLTLKGHRNHGNQTRCCHHLWQTALSSSKRAKTSASLTRK